MNPFRFFSSLRSSLERVERHLDQHLLDSKAQYEATRSQIAVLSVSLEAIGARGVAAPSSEDPGVTYRNGLHAVGVLNYQNDIVSGERRFLTNYISQFPNAVILDVGANAGQYAELVRELGPKTVIHSFEPHPKSFAKLSDLRDRLDVNVHAMALGDIQSEIEFFDYADDAGSQHASVYRDVIEVVHARPAASVKVRCETLDVIAPQLGIKHIGLLKIDTEGHDYSVLKGACGLLDAGLIDVIQFEFNEMNVISRVFMKDFFALLPGYRIYRLLSNGVIEFQTYDPTFMEVFAYQNIICIRRDIDPFWVHASE
ncbi:FkbM family methyltransferase [Tardiphaga sp. 862_B3_N4_1]|jgi:FkbM family methyltransferase|uniref:FkbM family methyltransferase n=1 Tax=Tardiphaga sp. 862_B3_N4_1 TaxID=3240764 RepID=UPI003F1FC329